MPLLHNHKNSMPEQVEENKKNIEVLSQYLSIKKSLISLTPTTASVPIAQTNISENGSKGILIDPNGLVFQILLVQNNIAYLFYLADLRGPKGDNKLESFDFKPIEGMTVQDGSTITFNGTLTYSTDGETMESIDASISIDIISGDQNIVVDVAEDNTAIIIKLDQAFLQRITNLENLTTQLGQKINQYSMLPSDQYIFDNTSIPTPNQILFTAIANGHFFYRHGVGANTGNNGRQLGLHLRSANDEDLAFQTHYINTNDETAIDYYFPMRKGQKIYCFSNSTNRSYGEFVFIKSEGSI